MTTMMIMMMMIMQTDCLQLCGRGGWDDMRWGGETSEQKQTSLSDGGDDGDESSTHGVCISRCAVFAILFLLLFFLNRVG